MRTMFAPANGAAAAAAAAAADFAQAFPSADIAMPTRFAPAPGRPRACLRRRRSVGIEWLAAARAAKKCYPRAADGAAAASVRVQSTACIPRGKRGWRCSGVVERCWLQGTVAFKGSRTLAIAVCEKIPIYWARLSIDR